MREIIYIFKKIKNKGMQWFAQRFFQELCAPQNKVSKILSICFKTIIYWLLIKPINFFKRKNYFPQYQMEADALLLIYDLSIEPVTYNFIFPLVTASYQCEKHKLHYLDVLLIKGDYHDLRQEEAAYEEIFSIAARHWRIQSILIGSLHLVKNFRHLFFVHKKQAEIYLTKYVYKYPSYYTLTTPITYFSRDAFVADPKIRCLSADTQSLQMMTDWLVPRIKGRKLITITLRQSAYYPDRNSNIEDWLRLAKSLDSQQYC